MTGLRAMDHLVLPSRDLAALADGYRRLGFTVGSRNRHPWGTENHIVQFRSSFIELIGFAEDFVAPTPEEPAFPFAGFLVEAVAKRPEGVAMVVLHSTDAEADAAAFAAAGIGTKRLLPFSRSARSPDGVDKTVAFTVAFAEAGTMPEIGFFICQQHRPENFWNPAVQRHANGASEIARVVIVAANPPLHAPFLSAFSGQRSGIGAPIEMLTSADFQRRYGLTPPAIQSEAHIAAMVLAVADLDQARGCLAQRGVDANMRGRKLIVQSGEAHGCALVFEPA